MKTYYKIHEVDENGNQTELVSTTHEETARKRFTEMKSENELWLSCQMEINGKSLGTTLLETK